MSVYAQTNMAVFSVSGTGAEYQVALNKGGTSSNTRQDLVLTVHTSSPTDNPFDVTKTYNVTIEEA